VIKLKTIFIVDCGYSDEGFDFRQTCLCTWRALALAKDKKLDNPWKKLGNLPL